MKVILTHNNVDFDGLASMIGAKKLYPYAEMVLPEKLTTDVAHFLAIYKDTFPFKKAKSINWERVKDCIVVDTNQLNRLGQIKKYITKEMNIHVYDHHIVPNNPLSMKGTIDEVGATITLITEKLIEKNIEVTPFEATVFALGVYSDTGAFTYQNTTARDLKAAAWFLEKGANLSIVERFRQLPLQKDANELFQKLLYRGEIITVDNVEIFIAQYEQEHYTGHLATITRKLIDVTGASTVFSVVKMTGKIFVTARSASDRVNVLPIIKELGGGGHPQAASAMRRNENVENVLQQIKTNLHKIVTPSITAESLMSSPVRVVAPDTTIEVVSKMLYRYGHTGFPVVDDEKIVGIISRRDVDKALHHGLGHAPVKGYMSREPITIKKDDSIETIQALMIEKNVGRLPVTENGRLVGIVSRTDVIEAMHGKNMSKNPFLFEKTKPKRNLALEMKQQFPNEIYSLLYLISKEATSLGMKAYLIGGMVRDLLLNRKNEDMDIVIEGDGIELAKQLQEKYGGHIRSHEKFRTATWKHPLGYKIDLTSARTEYYDFPAALPKVELSTIKEDLYRRDFTINAMGISLHENSFGDLIDFFHGYEDLKEKKIRVLYNLSFVEDPTRILRAIRFESRFRFYMDPQTESLAKESANNLLSCSKQRIANELRRMFLEENPLYAIERMYSLNIPPFLFAHRDEMENVFHRFSQLQFLLNEMKKNGLQWSNSLWVAYLIYMTPLHEHSFQEVNEYCLTKDDIKLVDDVQKLLAEKESIKELSTDLGDWHKYFSTVQTDVLLAAFPLLQNKHVKDGLRYVVAREKLENIVTGKDFIAIGLKPSPLFKELLLYSEILQLRNPKIEKEALMEKIKKYARENS